MRKVIFVGIHDLMVPHVNAVAELCSVSVYESGQIGVQLSEKVRIVPLLKTLFGIESFITGELSLPWRMKGLSKQLRADAPDVIVVLDFIRFWYWQVLWYKWRHPRVRVVLYSETQRVPKRISSAAAFAFFWLVFYVTKNAVSEVMVFTKIAYSFFKKSGFHKQISIIPAPVDIEIFKPNPERVYMPEGRLRLLCNARFVSYKRHIDVLKALAKLRIEGKDIVLTCIGRGGKEKFKIVEHVKDLGLDSAVSFAPTIERTRMQDVYNSHDVLVLASDNEAIGMVVPEAMACAMATVTSDTVGANVYVDEGVTGEIFKTRDVDMLTNKLRQFLLQKHLIACGISSAVKIKQEYSIEVCTEKFVSRILAQ